MTSSGNVDTERERRKHVLAGSFRLLAHFDVADGAAGHITVRDPELTDHFWVNPVRTPFSRMRSTDLMLIDEAGRIVEGHGMLNGAAFAIHSRLHRARPDVMAACHAHSVYGKAWSALGRLLDPLTQDACAFFDDHALFDGYSGVVFDLAEGDHIAVAIGARKACILQNHGLLTVGGSVEEAVWWYLAMDRACRVQLLAEAAGTPVAISADVARLTAAQVGTAEVARLSFDYLWDAVIDGHSDAFNDPATARRSRPWTT